MMYHCSISARDPRTVAQVLARIWRGEAHPFPPVAGGWIALAGDDRGTAIEVYPFGTEMVPGEQEVAFALSAATSAYVANHQAIGTPLTEEDVLDVVEAQGWRALRADRGPFAVIEVWLENRVMVEVLTLEMQRQYLSFMTLENWRRFLADAAAHAG